MEAQHWNHIKEVFAAALSLSGEDRARFLRTLHDGVRAELLSLLASYEQDGDALEQGPLTESAGLLRRALDEALPYATIGGYQILGEIGHGGMGAVYRAAREEGAAGVYALKIIRPGLNQQVLARRFRQELRILRELDHPYIAGVLDSGMTEDGQPFFVMNLIEGVPIDDYCDSKLLSLRERLVLFRKVCEAVQAAHSIGVIHRDLKPSNVLVTNDGTPQLLDFGIAKVVNPDLAGQTVDVTATVHRVMTPEYASPEQARGEGLTAASDVYSLGVLFYELLTGQRPYRVTRETPEAMLQAICTQQPLKPSSRMRRVTTAVGKSSNSEAEAISRKRGTSPELLKRRLRGELDNIAMKALAKDPRERYQTARQFGEDVQRYLDRVPITARGEPLGLRIRNLLPAKMAIPAVCGAALALLIVAVLLWRGASSRRIGGSVAVPARRSVAVLGFRDLRGTSDTEWLSTALAEMLSTELAATRSFRIVSGEDVARMKADLALVDRDSYRLATLKRIRQELGSDLVMSGSYMVTDERGAGEIRLDITLQEAGSGDIVARLSERGDEKQLFDLISRTGADLRMRLGTGESTAQELEAVRASIAAKPEAARLYAEGLDRLRVFEYRAAAELLQQATQLDPGYPLAHAALAEVWSDLGFDQRAQQEAKAAFDRSGGMLREGRLWVEGQYRMTTHDYGKAIQMYEALLKVSPDDVDYGLRLVAADIAAGKPGDALNAVKSLRELPPLISDDPRLDVAEAEGAESAGQYQRAYEMGKRAAEKAKAMGARLLWSRATLLQARVLAQLGRYSEAFAATGQARRLAHEAGDTRGEAVATRVLGRMFLDRTDLSDARETFADAYKLFSGIGDEAGVALVLRDQGALQSVAGNPDAALRLNRQALEKARDIGDTNLAAHALNSIGVDLHLKGDLAGAVAPLEECIRLARETGNQSALMFGTGSLGEVRFDLGDLPGAQQALEESIRVGEASGETRGSAYAQLYLARVLALEGKGEEAQQNVARSLQVWKQRQDEAMIAYSGLVRTEIALIEGDKPDAEKVLEDAAAVFASKKNPSFQLEAYTVLLRLATAKTDHLKERDLVERLQQEFAALRDSNFGFWLDAQLAIEEAMCREQRPSEAESRFRKIIAVAAQHGYGRQREEAEAQLGRLKTRGRASLTR